MEKQAEPFEKRPLPLWVCMMSSQVSRQSAEQCVQRVSFVFLSCRQRHAAAVMLLTAAAAAAPVAAPLSPKAAAALGGSWGRWQTIRSLHAQRRLRSCAVDSPLGAHIVAAASDSDDGGDGVGRGGAGGGSADSSPVVSAPDWPPRPPGGAPGDADEAGAAAASPSSHPQRGVLREPSRAARANGHAAAVCGPAAPAAHLPVAAQAGTAGALGGAGSGGGNGGGGVDSTGVSNGGARTSDPKAVRAYLQVHHPSLLLCQLNFFRALHIYDNAVVATLLATPLNPLTSRDIACNASPMCVNGPQDAGGAGAGAAGVARWETADADAVRAADQLLRCRSCGTAWDPAEGLRQADMRVSQLVERHQARALAYAKEARTAYS